MRLVTLGFATLLAFGCGDDGGEPSSAEILCDFSQQCDPAPEFDRAACVAEPGRTLDIPDEDIDCLAECVSQYDTCEEVVAGCDNEEPGTPCYAL